MAVISNIDNEKIKLTAGFLNTVAAALLSVGLIVPFADIVLRDAKAPSVIGSALYLAAALTAHLLARKSLDQLEQEE